MLAWQTNECSTGRVVWFSVCLSIHLVRPDLDPTFTNLLTLWPSADYLTTEPAWFYLGNEDNISLTELSSTFRRMHRPSSSASESSETLLGWQCFPSPWHKACCWWDFGSDCGLSSCTDQANLTRAWSRQRSPVWWGSSGLAGGWDVRVWLQQ